MSRLHPRRSAFTLVELLVVVAIIAILIALIMGGVMKVRSMAVVVQNRNDLLQIHNGLQAFYKKYNFYPPDQFKLCSKWSSYNASVPLDALSMSYLGTMWPNLDRNATFNWAGGTPFPEGVILEGDQCLVFFLGGMPTGPGQAPQGFFMNPSNPTMPVGTSTDRLKWLDFDGARCIPLRGNPFPSYLDSHATNNDGIMKKKSAFVYFSSGKRADGYGAANALFGVAPYIQTAGVPTKFFNSTSYQLISAGPDGAFGPGGLWVPGAGPSGGALVGRDDVSNFYADRNLGD
jgi:prepilin-type N-terminal cleavage/methylation domain-containing protein